MWGLRSLQSVEKNKNRLKSDKITEIRSLEEAIEAMRKPEYHFRLIDPALKLQLEQKSWFRKEKDRTNPHMIDLNNSALDDSDVIQLLLFLGAQELHGIALMSDDVSNLQRFRLNRSKEVVRDSNEAIGISVPLHDKFGELVSLHSDDGVTFFEEGLAFVEIDGIFASSFEAKLLLNEAKMNFSAEDISKLKVTASKLLIILEHPHFYTSKPTDALERLLDVKSRADKVEINHIVSSTFFSNAASAACKDAGVHRMIKDPCGYIFKE